MNNLTLLQRGVIKRLREAGYGGVADRALESWSRGEPTGWLFDDENVAHGTSALSSLRDDYERANKQAVPPDR